MKTLNNYNTNEFQIPSEVDRKYSDNEEYIFEFDSELC